MRVGILGGGRWGVALSTVVAPKVEEVLIYDINSDVLKAISEGKHPYLSGIDLSKNIKPADSLKPLERSDVLVCALPVQVVRSVFSKLENVTVVVNASKGLEVGTFKRVSEIIKEIHPQAEVYVLSGPSFAEEVSKGLPTAVVLGYGSSKEKAEKIRDLFNSARFRVYLNPDLIGVELGGALKNVIAIACGISDGLGFGHNARAGLITRGLSEMARIGEALGAKRETFFGLSGMGDLILTATSDLSRNRSFGLLLGKGLSPEEALREIGQVVEGVKTVEALKPLTDKLGIRAPIINAVYDVVVRRNPLEDVVKNLLLRPPREEFD